MKTSGNTKYFNMRLLSQDPSRSAVCCSPQWKKGNRIMWNDKSPILITDHLVTTKRGSEDFIINKTQPAITCWKLIIATPEQEVNYVQS